MEALRLLRRLPSEQTNLACGAMTINFCSSSALFLSRVSRLRWAKPLIWVGTTTCRKPCTADSAWKRLHNRLVASSQMVSVFSVHCSARENTMERWKGTRAPAERGGLEELSG